jgi:type IV secretion system protein VirD4
MALGADLVALAAAAALSVGVVSVRRGDRGPEAGGGRRRPPARTIARSPGSVSSGWWTGAGRPAGRSQGGRWAGRSDLRALRTRGPGRLVLGTQRGAFLGPGRLLSAEPAQSVTVIGPSQSGKTTSLAVPAILGWEGPVVAASVKTDLLRDTLPWRRRLGQVWCFDPVAVTGQAPSPWSPLASAATWAGARRVAGDLTEVARGQGTTADGDFWYATAAKLLAPLLLAAARSGRAMADVVRWVDTQEVAEVMEALQAAGCEEALQAAQASWLRDERQRSSVYTTAETVLEPFAEPGLQAGEGLASPVDVGWLLQGPHTLYLCAPAHDQRRLVGLFTALVKEVIQAAFTRSARRGAPLDPPLLVVLDEAANIAPLAELDGLAATCAGHGVQLVTVWQDLAQVQARYGERAATVINNHRAKVFLPGISDPATLEHASRLTGEEERLVPSVTRDRTGLRSTTEALVTRRLLPPERLRCLPKGTGVLVYGTLPPALFSLRPWWEAPELAGRGPAPQAS